jgi:hypothetical protein
VRASALQSRPERPSRAKHDPRARPIDHEKRKPIDAHATVISAALALTRLIKHNTGWSINETRAHRPPLLHHRNTSGRPP